MYVRGLFVTSLAALLPLLIILFGVGFKFQVAVVFLFSVFFVIVNAAAGARDVPRNLMRTGEAFCVSPPAALHERSCCRPSLPYIVVGLRLAIANAYTGMVLAELWVGVGTGGILKNMGQNRDLPKFFAMVVLITALAAFSSHSDPGARAAADAVGRRGARVT